MRPHPFSTQAARLVLSLLAAAALLPSCAYMQTHKNVKELGRSYQGYKLEKPRQLFRSQGTWYVVATPASYRQKHDFVHDNVFRKTNEPTMELHEEATGQVSFHAISDNTATVLLRQDGYADSATIAREISGSNSPWLSTLPAASVHTVKAELVGEESTAITYSPTPAQPSLGYQLLSGLDLLLVDVPGTVAYNVAVPFIAPFVFFYEFLSD